MLVGSATVSQTLTKILKVFKTTSQLRQFSHGSLDSNGFPTIRVLRVRTPFETAQVLRKLMGEALEHVANLERPAKRCRLVERHRDAAIDLEEDPDDEELARASAASADFIKGLTMADLTKCLLKGANC